MDVKESLIEGIIKAKKEALRRDIRANAVLINDRQYFSQIYPEGREISMICGLKAFYTDELPDDTLFAVVEADVRPVEESVNVAELKKENEMLKDKLTRIMKCLEGVSVE